MNAPKNGKQCLDSHPNPPFCRSRSPPQVPILSRTRRHLKID